VVVIYTGGKTMIGRPYSPTDLSSPLIRKLGHTVTADTPEGPVTGTLSNVTEDGMASLEIDGFCAAIVPVEAVK
jgi:hypothetical protein